MKSIRFRCTTVSDNNHTGKPEDSRRTASFQILPEAPENKDFFGADPAEAGFSVSTRTSDTLKQFAAGKEYVVSFAEASPAEQPAAQ
jgi:hypothetical protein